MSKSCSISKLEAAKRQLITAIVLYFHWGDSVSIHTLACASKNVLQSIRTNRSVKSQLSIDELVDEIVAQKFKKEFRLKIKEPENFFKHADRDPENVLEFCEEVTEYILLDAVESYSIVTQQCVPELHVFRAWFLLQHQGYLTNSSDEFLQKLGGVSYTTGERERFFEEMIQTISN
jgi:hypothetical protein